MWVVEQGKDVVSGENVFCMMNLDSNGKEIRRVGDFKNKNSAEGLVIYLNKLETNMANFFANYICIDTFLHRLIEEQDRIKFKQMMEEDVDLPF